MVPVKTLAVSKGVPVRTTPLPTWPSYTEEEVARVAEVLRTGEVNYWTGDQGKCFEAEYAASLGRRHAVALANGTVALELALRALGIAPGDEVIVTPRSFCASASTVVQCGAKPIFVDVDLHSQNITAETIESAITNRTRAVVLVHLAGWPCDMKAICSLVSRYNLMLIEDCAQAHGAKFEGQLVGSFGDVATFSFCQDKIITTCGEGGLLVTDDTKIWERAWAYKDHGKSYSAVHVTNHQPGFKWLHESVGSNYRMTELQAAIGRIQLSRLSQYVGARRENAKQLTSCFSELPLLRITIPPQQLFHSYYKYYVFVRPKRLAKGWTRDRLIMAISAEGIPIYSGSCPEIYREKVFSDLGYQPKERLPAARELGETSLMFPVHPTLQAADIDDICAAVTKVVMAASM